MNTHLVHTIIRFCVTDLRNSPAITCNLRLESDYCMNNLLHPELISGSLSLLF